jgi:hypothetical protein
MQSYQIRASDKLLDSAEVAAIIGCHPETVTRARRSGKLRGHYLGRRMVRYRLEDVNLWLDNSRHLSPPAKTDELQPNPSVCSRARHDVGTITTTAREL